MTLATLPRPDFNNHRDIPEYRPRAMFGDYTVEGARRIDAYANPDGVLIETREALA